MYGGNGGNEFSLERSGMAIGSFHGRSGDYLDSLGVYFISDVPVKIIVEDVEFDT